MRIRAVSLALSTFCVVLLVALLVVLALNEQRVRAAGVVGDGTPASCTQLALTAAVSGGGSVTFNCGPAQHFIVLSSPIYITSLTAIDGGDKIVLSGNNATRIFIISSMGNLHLSNIVLANGYSAQDGGAINMTGPATFANVTIRDSRSDLSGGAIAAIGVPITATDSLFEDNRAATGGAIYARFGTSIVRLQNVDFRDNEATLANGSGGAILPWDGAVVHMQGGEAQGNQADQGGFAALLHADSRFYVSESALFQQNRGELGGVFFSTHGTISLEDAILTRNEAESGGAIYTQGESVEVTRTVFLSNTALNGGAVYAIADPAPPSLVGSQTVFRGNSSTVTGGALYLANAAVFLMNSTLRKNYADSFGGAIFANQDTYLEMENATLSENFLTDSAPEAAGGALFLWGQARVRSSTFAKNSAGEGGSVFFELNSDAEFHNVVLAESAGGNCGGVFAGSASHNHSSDASCNFPGLTNETSTNPELGPLQNNGGFVDTMLPQEGSPLIDGGDCGEATLSDARGVSRPQLGACDIGAVEVPAAPLPTATPTATPSPTLTPTLTPTTTPTGTLTQTPTPTPTMTPGTPTFDHQNYQPMINR